MEDTMNWALGFFEQPGLTHLPKTSTTSGVDDGDFISKLPEGLRDGRILIDDDDLLTYIYVYIGSAVFFLIMFHVIKFIFDKSNWNEYTDKNDDDRTMFIVMWTSQIHHIFVPLYATSLIYGACSTGEPWGWMKSDVCMMEMNKGFVYCVMITLGFMAQEFCQMHFRIKNPTILIKQMKIHHVGAYIGYTCSLFAGYGYPSISAASLCSEYSSIFLNYKDMFRKYKDTPLGIVNQIFFLVVYTAMRVVFFPFLTYRCFLAGYLVSDQVSMFRRICMTITNWQAVLMTLLQYFWFYLIMKNLVRFL